MNTMILGAIVLLVAGILQGSFGLGMKNYKPLSWEAFWALYSILGMVIFPIIWVRLEVPNFMEYIIATPTKVLLISSICGFLWGITAIGFGKAIDFIGMSLTYGISMGISAAVGSWVPLLMMNQLPPRKIIIGLAIGTVVMLCGVYVITKAGIINEKEKPGDIETANKSKIFKLGLILTIIAGVGSAAQNIGFSYAGYASNLAIESGVNPTSASLICWIIVFSGGIISNLGYAVYLLIKNKTYTQYFEKGILNAYVKVIITSIVWICALAIYGKSTAILGSLGTVVGWIGFNALALIVSNGWGLKTGEWSKSTRAKKVLLYGNVVLILSWTIIGVVNGASL